MKIGDAVSINKTVLAGRIADTEYNKDTHTLRHLVEYDDEGVAQHRWFDESQLIAVAT